MLLNDVLNGRIERPFLQKEYIFFVGDNVVTSFIGNMIARYGPIVTFFQHVATLIPAIARGTLYVIAGASTIWSIYLGVQLMTAEDDKARSKAKQRIVWSLIAVVITLGLIVVFNTVLSGWQIGDDGGLEINQPPAPPPSNPIEDN